MSCNAAEERLQSASRDGTFGRRFRYLVVVGWMVWGSRLLQVVYLVSGPWAGRPRIQSGVAAAVDDRTFSGDLWDFNGGDVGVLFAPSYVAMRNVYFEFWADGCSLFGERCRNRQIFRFSKHTRCETFILPLSV